MSYDDAVSRNFPVSEEEMAKALEHTCCEHCGPAGHAPHSQGCPDDEAPPGAPLAPTEFERDLEHLINRHCVENESDTPDFILADYLRRSLDVFNATIRARDKWYGYEPWPDRNCELGQ